MTRTMITSNQSVRYLTLASLLAGSLLLAACNSTGSGNMSGRELNLRYATVVGVSRVDMPSAAPAGAIIGGFTGLVLSQGKSTRSQVASGVGGAVLGGLAARALEGDNRGYAYDLRFRNNSESRFITEKGYLRTGDCVLVERGQYANMRRVDYSHCANNNPPTDQQQRDADQCHTAKQQLLDASNEADISTAARKVELLCKFKA